MRAELEQAQAAVQQERAAAASVHAELEQAQAAVQQERAAAASIRAELDQAQAAVQQERAAAATRERDLAALRQTLEQEQAARASLERKAVDANAAVETERTAAATLQQRLVQLESAHRLEHDAGAARERDLAAVQQALEQELKQEQTANVNVRRELEEARTAAVSVQQALDQAHAALKSARAGAGRDQDLAAAQDALERDLKREQAAHANVRRELEEARTAAVSVQQALDQAHAALKSERASAGRDQDLAAAKDALEKELKREQAAHAKLREQFEAARHAPEGDRATRQPDLERAVKDAQARAEAATLGHRKVLAELEALKQSAFANEADAKVRYEKLRDAADQQIRSLQLKVSDADQRAAAAEGDLDLLRREAKARDASAGGAPLSAPSRAPAAAVPAAAAPAAGQSTADGPVRAAKRTAMTGEVDIQIDGNASKLIDLSTTGAQILSPGALKPNRLITLILPLAEGRVSCKGKIMWSRLEPGRKGGLWYRAGISFTSADEAAIEQFLNHQSRGT
jgi:chromosome segregation ATPase